MNKQVVSSGEKKRARLTNIELPTRMNIAHICGQVLDPCLPNQGNSALCGNPPPASLCLCLPCRDKIANSVLQPTASTACIHNQLPILKPHHSPSLCLNNSRSHQTKYLAIFWPNRRASIVLVSRGCLAKVLGYLLQEEGGLYLSLSPARAPPELISAPCFAQEAASPVSPASSSVTVWLLYAQGGAADNQRQYDEATSPLCAV